MRDLLKADFSRLLKNKVFLIFTTGLFIISCYYSVSFYIAFSSAESINDFTIYPLETMPIVSFLIAVCTAFFVGTNFTDKIIRNKLSKGHSKAQIYFSNAIVSLFVSVVFSLFFVINAIGIIKLGVIPAGIYFAILSIGIITSLVFSCISTFFSFVIRGKAVPAVILIALFAGMFLLSSNIGSILGEPELCTKIDTVNGVPYNEVNVITSDAEVTFKQQPNPNYCSGTKRKVYEFVSEILPTSHLSILSNIYVSSTEEGVWFAPHYSDNVKIESADDVYKYVNVFYTLGFCVAVTALGVLIFRKEQLA